jgi:hypothetical protein
MSARVALACLVLAAAPVAARAALDLRHESTVGVPARVEGVVLPAPELEPVPVTRDAPMVVRVLSVAPHGTAFRYDIEYCGLEPGEHDLGRWLQPVGGAVAAELPPIPVTIRSLLPPGQVLPSSPGAREMPVLGGYGLALGAGAIAWAWVLWLLVTGKRAETSDAGAAHARPRTLAERLRPLVERGLAGELSLEERARLELSLVAFWRRRLGLDDRSPASALHELRAHPEAGPLLATLETWLHAPEPREPVDVAALLAPYRDLPSDALEAPLESAARA